MTDDELIAEVADKIEARMGPLMGSPEYLADPVKRARSEKRRRESAEIYARMAVESVLASRLASLTQGGEVARIATLFDAIAHGDDIHREWLKQAIEDHFAGKPVERVRSAPPPSPAPVSGEG